MGKLEVLGVAVAVVAFVGMHRSERPIEAKLLTTTEALMRMSRAEFEAWCGEKGAKLGLAPAAGEPGTATCAWLDKRSSRVWHAALHFDGRLSTPVKADNGLVEPSNEMLRRLVHKSYGPQDGETGEGFPTWEVDIDGQPGRLTVAEFEDITVVRMARIEEPGVLSMR